MVALIGTRAVVVIFPAEAASFHMMLPAAATFYVLSYAERTIDPVLVTSADLGRAQGCGPQFVAGMRQRVWLREPRSRWKPPRK